ncbi:glycoside hydrolase family 88 protein [Saccharophagus degradans]|uniref:glycoside hydrolase family 88/105 protein n=1 Tax=Saccharophagus degradans TaxID=86304 RepID=UPI001C08E7DE|nr:glycoside hydrolase family 88 protein [Saccharophagus degradans]MBU2984245.1 glycoside hydrolase family 88 protein [Saccharophagus degradans]
MKAVSIAMTLVAGLAGAGCVASNDHAVSSEANKPYSTDVWPENVEYRAPGTTPIKYSLAFDPKSVAVVANQVADWQLAQFDIRSNKMRPEERASAIPQGWIYATQNIGLLRWGETRNDQQYIQAVRNLSAINEWRVGPRFYHADDHAMGSVYMDLYERYNKPYMIENLKQTFDWVLANPSDRTLEFEGHEKEVMLTAHRKFEDPWCTERWCWADAIFMSPPVWAQLSQITGNKSYLEFMDKEFWATTDYLYSTEESLYLRDSRYFTRKDSNGKLIYWGRGNGWVLAGIARLIPHLPEDFENRAKYVQLFKDMSKHIQAAQNPDGSWPSSLLDTSMEPVPESSGTGLLAFGLAWGINNGLLDPKVYTPTVKKAWESLVNSVDENGRLGWVQQVAFAPGSATAKDTELYGTGALLLAAAEITVLLENQK